MSLSRLAQWFLGIPPSSAGQGTTWKLSHAFPWPIWALVIFLIASAVAVTWIYRKDAAKASRAVRTLLIGLRMGAVCILLLMLTELVLSVERTDLPYLVVLLDVSRSMAREDQYAQPADRAAADRLVQAAEVTGRSRLDVARATLIERSGQFLRTMMDGHKVRLYGVADTVQPIGPAELLNEDDLRAALTELGSLQTSGNETRLGDAIRRVLNELRGSPPTAIVLLTDGVVTDGESLASASRLARQKAVPLYTAGLGSADPVRDIELHDLLVDEVAFVDDPVTFSYRLTAHGAGQKTARVKLTQTDKPAALVTENVTLPRDGQTQKYDLIFTPTETGEFEFVVEVEPAKGEVDVSNNRESRRISIRKEKIRVLLVDNAPRWEYRELKFMLEREKSVDLKVVLLEADPGYTAEDKFALTAMPVRKEEILAYDVIILGDVDPDVLGRKVLEHLRDFVSEKGGGLILVAGPEYSPTAFAGSVLDPLFPVELAGTRDGQTVSPAPYRAELTIEGRKATPMFRFGDSELESQQIWDQLPEWQWYVDAAGLKPGASALAVHPSRAASRGRAPIISMQRYGAGKVLFHASDETWRWRYRVGDLYFGRYWIQAIRYLARSRMVGRDRAAELTVDRRTYRAGDDVAFRVRFLDERLIPVEKDGVTVVVERTGRPQQKLVMSRVLEAPSVFEGTLTNPGEGQYHAFVASPGFKDAPPSCDFQVRVPARETRTARADLAELTRAAETSRGRFYTPSRFSRLLSEIPAGFPIPVNTDRPIDLWNHWFGMMLLVGLLSVEWIIRKRLQLA